MARLGVLLLVVLVRSTAGLDDVVFDFLRDYASDDFFWTPVYTALDCDDSNDVKWARSVTQSSHGLVTVRRTTDALLRLSDDRQTFILNVRCPEAESLLLQANSSNLFRSPFHWLLIDEDAFAEIDPAEDKWYWSTLQTLRVLLDAEIRITVHGNDTVGIVEGYKTWMGSELIRVDIGQWSAEEGLVLRTRESTAIRRWNVRGAPLPGSFVVTHPETLSHLEDMVDKHIDPISKVGYVLMKHFAEMINASMEMKIVDTWGVNINGTWTGMVGDLQSGAAEIGISPAFVLEERMAVINYYEMITPTRAKFIFLSPPLSFSSNIFTMPFHKMVWLSCLMMVLVSCILLYLATKLEAKAREAAAQDDGADLLAQKPRDSGGHDGLKDSLSDILMLNVGAICLQGTVVEPKGPSGRIITLFLYFSYMFLYVSYSGSIVALLQSSDTSIRSFKDLLESPLVVGVDDVVYSKYYFMTEKEPIRKALYEKKVAPKGQEPHFLPAEEGIKNLRKGLYAFHVETSVGYSLIQKTFTEEEKCGLQEFKVSFFQSVDPLLAMKIHTPFAELLKVGLKRIIERGLNHRALRRIYTKKPICSSKSSRFVSVGLLDCYHAFMIVLYGTLIAWFILLLEKLTKGKVERLREKLCLRQDEIEVLD